jgi:pimeloyl-ACP methyl ester carboxylesterase
MFASRTAPHAAERVAEQRAFVRGRPVRFLVAGDAARPPVVLVHGLSASSRWWRRTVPALAPHFRLYLVDLPGFGAMRRPLGHYSLAEAPSWLIDWMDELRLARPHLVGHSMGGYISLCLAAKHPERIERLALVAPAGVPYRRSVVRYGTPLVRTAWVAAPRFFPLVLPDALRTGPLTLWQAARQLLREDVRPLLSRVTCPTLLVWGERDYLVPPAHADVLLNALPDARLVRLPGAGHVPMEDRPDAFNAALLAFLRGETAGH